MKLRELIEKANLGDVLYVNFTLDGEYHCYESHESDLEKYLDYDVEDFDVCFRYDNIIYDEWGYKVTLNCYELA